VLVLAAFVEFTLLLVVGITLTDAEGLAFAFVVAAATAWSLWRRSRIPVVVRSLIFADVLYWMAPGALSNLANHDQLGAILAPMGLAVTSAVGLVASAGYLLRRQRPEAGRRLATGTALFGVAAMVAGLVATAAQSSTHPRPFGSNDLSITVHQAKFSTTSLTASPGSVTLDVTNNDLFWHTVTIQQLGVDVRVPVKGRRSVTFNASRGTYKFKCAIPGHESIGMKGTLTVQ
jgi:plastocyanin